MDAMKKIAKLSIKGTPRQSKAIVIGMIMVYVFSMMVVVVQESIVKSKQEYSYERHGAWSGAIYNGNENIEKELYHHSDIDKIGSIHVFTNIQVLGEDYLASIGHIDKDAISLGRLRLMEGSFPKQEDEIVVEKYVLDKMHPDAKIGDEIRLPLKVEQEGQNAIKHKVFRLSGVIDRWHREWMKEGYALPSVFVAEEASFDFPLMVQQHYFFTAKDAETHEIKNLAELLSENQESTYVFNSQSYSIAQSTADRFFEKGTTISMVCLIALIVIIYILSGTLKSKKYKIRIMKGIGAEHFQLFRLTLWEALYYWGRATIIGVPLGLVLSAAIIYLTKNLMIFKLRLFINWSFIFITLLFITLVFFAGNLIILLSITFQKLTTSLRQDNSHTQKAKLPVIKKIKKLTLYQLYKRNRVFYKKQSLLRIGISIITIVVLCTSAVHFINAYQHYSRMRSHNSYEYQIDIWDMEEGLDEQAIGQFEKIPGIIAVEKEKVFRSDEDPILIHWEGWKESQYINTLRKYNREGTKAKGADYFEVTSIAWTSKENQDIFQWCQEQISEGKLDYEKFMAGEQCVLVLSPFYLEESSFTDIQYAVQPVINDFQYEKAGKIYDYRQEENRIQAGDFITLESRAGTKNIEVGGVVEGVTELVPNQVILGSGAVAVGEGLLNDLTSKDVSQLYNMITLKSFANVDYVETDRQVEILAESLLGSEHSRYSIDNSRPELGINMMLAKMLQAIVMDIIMILLFVGVMYQGSVWRMEDEGHRIKVLHSLGMPKFHIKKMYRMEYILEGIIAGGIGLFVALAVQMILLKAEFKYPSISAIIEVAKSDYPASPYLGYIYGFTLLFYFLVYLLMGFHPMMKALKENSNE
ncbi:ABC transporter permease [Irregularibacter muris]|uniref:ABC transporter permease n=1 Tax=Irregularibacter muris TaxID=1796619 RepID=A0AAE3HHF0_9FIRM|nr:ABC transporter permease [Irregularibacter muris]MCR1898628.1 ABC transporter permease [Irregularibacter muris]